jgi:hypothetical protein
MDRFINQEFVSVDSSLPLGSSWSYLLLSQSKLNFDALGAFLGLLSFSLSNEPVHYHVSFLDHLLDCLSAQWEKK